MTKSIKITATIRTVFRFLETDFEFRHTYASEDDLRVDYKRTQKNVGIRIQWCHQSQYFFLHIYRLVYGEMLDNDEPINGKTVIHSIEFTDALERSRRMLPGYKYDESCSYFDEVNGLENYFVEFANRLRQFGADFLAGDFSRFPMIVRKIKRRARYYRDHNL